MVMNPVSQRAALYLDEHFDRFLKELSDLVRIPSVSFNGFDPAEVRRSAEAVAILMKKIGLDDVEILEVPGAHPYVFGQWMKAPPGSPTVLLYAHHDVQPPGQIENWKSEPFEPTLREGPNGMRLYARGAADDKAGIIAHLASIESYLKTDSKIPVNVKVIIEGEEEIGSTHLATFLKTYRHKLESDVMVLADSTNFDTGVPALTIALRGLIDFEIEMRALTKSVHSGMWGGPLPDPAMALSKLLAKLVDDDGMIAIPGVNEQLRPVSDKERDAFSKIPTNVELFRKQAGMVPTAKLLMSGASLAPEVQVWRFPSLSVNAIQASSREQAGNIVNATAWAKVTVRLADGMDAHKTRELVETFLRAHTPWGLEIKITGERGTGPWSVDPHGPLSPIFDKAITALKRGYGRDVVLTGCGGSIPFAQPFTDTLGANGKGVALLVGVEDPYTDAHGENESLHLQDFKKAILSEIYLFEELSK